MGWAACRSEVGVLITVRGEPKKRPSNEWWICDRPDQMGDLGLDPRKRNHYES
jgi:hypothetical protein